MNELELIPFRILIDRVVIPARRYARAILLPIAVPIMASSVAVSLAQIAWFETLSGTAPDPDAMPRILLTGCSLLVLVLLVLVVYALSGSALMVAAVDAVAGRPVSMARAWAFVFRPRMLGAVLLLFFCVLGSFVMCLLPALYVVPLLSFVLPAIIDEDLTVGDAFRRSVELMHWNPTGRLGRLPVLQAFGLVAVGYVLQYSVNLTVQLPFLSVQQVVMMRRVFSGEVVGFEEMTPMLWLQVPAVTLGAIATALTWLYSAFGVALLFREVRRRKEASDLEEAVAELTGSR